MNKKLLCSTALVGALMVSGSALAELKIGGNVTNTINFGSDEATRDENEGILSDERLGTEMNISLLSKKDLNNGMYIQYGAAIEYDDGGNDVEYEIQLGTKDFYVGAGSDRGNNIASTPTLPAVGFHIGTLAGNVSSVNPINNDGLVGAGTTDLDDVAVVNNNEATDSPHLSLNANVAGGLASVIYAPSNTNNSSVGDDDTAGIEDQPGGSVITYIYQGSPIAKTTFIAARNVITADDTDDGPEVTTDKIGVSYNFGKIRAGYEYQKATYEADDVEDFVLKAHNYAVTFAASDNVTLGVQHSRSTTNDEVEGLTEREKLTALSVGYNLGGASIAVSLVEAENLRGVEGDDTQGLVITTRMGF
jgi:hypothetical protein